LDAAAKADLDKLAALALSTDGYMIEIAGYASKTGTKAVNQQLSEDRAAAVANYLRSHGNKLMRRILAPAGYGARPFRRRKYRSTGSRTQPACRCKTDGEQGLQGAM
jgi:outer membrane protein OmpA-like peptidoglycan-associated protein